VTAVYDLDGRGVFHAVELGPKDAPPVIWLHGFPDHPPSALPFLEHLTKHRRVIAPWLRGYAPSPTDGPYDLDTLVGDVGALIDKLGVREVDLVGHDWGAAITYATCMTMPDKIRRAVTLALPHPLTFLRALRTGAQMRRSWYMALFQIPGSERLVRANDFAMIDHLWRVWSPGFELDPMRRAALHTCLAASLPGPLGSYRAIVRPLSQFSERVKKFTIPITTPLLQLHGENDGCIGVPSTDDDRRFTQRELLVLPDVGHFLHLEAPAAIAEHVVRWIV
jgi:pimeloyl-ACP methyl ester carboxylesterase